MNDDGVHSDYGILKTQKDIRVAPDRLVFSICDSCDWLSSVALVVPNTQGNIVDITQYIKRISTYVNGTLAADVNCHDTGGNIKLPLETQYAITHPGKMPQQSAIQRLENGTFIVQMCMTPFYPGNILTSLSNHHPFIDVNIELTTPIHENPLHICNAQLYGRKHYLDPLQKAKSHATLLEMPTLDVQYKTFDIAAATTHDDSSHQITIPLDVCVNTSHLSMSPLRMLLLWGVDKHNIESICVMNEMEVCAHFTVDELERIKSSKRIHAEPIILFFTYTSPVDDDAILKNMHLGIIFKTMTPMLYFGAIRTKVLLHSHGMWGFQMKETSS